MVQLKKILVAFDGSENGLKALEAAKKLTIDNQAQLTVIYVHDSALENSLNVSTTVAGDSFLYMNTAGMDPGPMINDAPIPAVEEETIVVEEERPIEVMNIAERKLADIDNVTYKKLVGKPAEEIINYANPNDIDLIVIGNRGIGAFKKMFMGSVSNKVTDHSECSVFVVK